jgi:hypothetical protein
MTDIALAGHAGGAPAFAPLNPDELATLVAVLLVLVLLLLTGLLVTLRRMKQLRRRLAAMERSRGGPETAPPA